MDGQGAGASPLPIPIGKAATSQNLRNTIILTSIISIIQHFFADECRLDIDSLLEASKQCLNMEWNDVRALGAGADAGRGRRQRRPRLFFCLSA